MELGNLQQWLHDAGITPEVLLLAGLVSLITLFFTFRELICWYLKVPSLREEIRLLRSEIFDLKSQISQMSSLQDMELLKSDTHDVLFNQSKEDKPFRLNH